MKDYVALHLILTQPFSVLLISILFIIAGILHFLQPEPYLRIMPDFIPYQKAMVYISGAFEILGGIGFLITDFRILAGWGLVALLFTVFPANINMFMKGYKKHRLSLFTWIALIRLPIQFVLMFWIYWAGIK